MVTFAAATKNPSSLQLLVQILMIHAIYAELPAEPMPSWCLRPEILSGTQVG